MTNEEPVTEAERGAGTDGCADQARLARIGATGFGVKWRDGGAAALVARAPEGLVGRDTAPLVELFSAAELRSRTSRSMVRSAIGSCLAVEQVQEVDGGVEVQQLDPVAGIIVLISVVAVSGARSLRIESSIFNGGAGPVLLSAASAAAVGIGRSHAQLDPLQLYTGQSEWLAENRWTARSLRAVLPDLSLSAHGQHGRGRFVARS